MTTTAKAVANTAYAANAQTTVYTVPAGTRFIIDKFTGSNNSGANQTLAVNIVPSGGTAGASNLVVPAKTIVTGDPPEIFPGVVGQILNAGDGISLLASASNAIVYRLCGREITT